MCLCVFVCLFVCTYNVKSIIYYSSICKDYVKNTTTSTSRLLGYYNIGGIYVLFIGGVFLDGRFICFFWLYLCVYIKKI